MVEYKLMDTFNINGVEIFSAGKWNGDEYTVQDLDQMVVAFENLKNGFRPYLKLGHDPNQFLAKSAGIPSVGWVDRVYIKGEKLLGDFSNIPKKIFNLIKTKAYRKVSCEIYWNLDVNGTIYPKVLSAVALLGAEMPGVLNLADILGNYSIDQKMRFEVFKSINEQDNIKQYDINFDTPEELMADTTVTQTNEEMEVLKTELENQKKIYSEVSADLKAEIENQKKLYSEITEAKLALEKTREEELKELETLRAEAMKSRAEAEQAKLAQFVAELSAKNLVSNATKDLVVELMSDKKEFSVGEKKYTKEEMVTELLSLTSELAKVNFEESSRAEFAKGKNKDEELDEKIAEYAKEHKCSYAQAYKAVMKSKKEE